MVRRKYSVEIKRALSNAATAVQAERARLEKLEEVARMDTWESLVCALAILRPDPPVIAVSLGEAGRGEGLPVCPSAQHLHEGLLFGTRLLGNGVCIFQHRSSRQYCFIRGNK